MGGDIIRPGFREHLVSCRLAVSRDMYEHNGRIPAIRRDIRETTDAYQQSKLRKLDKRMKHLPVELVPISYAFELLNGGERRNNIADWVHRDRLLIHKFRGRYACCENRVDLLAKAYPKILEACREYKQTYMVSKGWDEKTLTRQYMIDWRTYLARANPWGIQGF